MHFTTCHRTSTSYLLKSVGDKAAERAQELAHEFSLPTVEAVPHVSDPDVTAFSFQSVSTTKVRNIIKNMQSHKSPGYDKVGMKVIKVSTAHPPSCNRHVKRILNGGNLSPSLENS